MKCSNCGHELPDNLKFCPYCGDKLIEETINHRFKEGNKCYSCDSELPNTNIFYCPYCGSKLTDCTWGINFKEFEFKDLDCFLQNLNKNFWTIERREFIINKFYEENLKAGFQFINLITIFHLNDTLIDTEMYYLEVLDKTTLREELDKIDTKLKYKINLLVKYENTEITRRDIFREFHLRELPINR